MNLDKIYGLNPWFENKNFLFSEKKQRKRFIFNEIKQNLSAKLIISLSGLRRVGKTTLLRQFANFFLKQKTAVFYYQFSESDTELSNVLKYFFKEKVTGLLQNMHVVILLDEMQYIPNWQEILKYYYDINRNIQFIITGSASLYLHEATKESSAGRILDFSIKPLAFDEYLYLKYGIKPSFKHDFMQTPKVFISQWQQRNNSLKKFTNKVKEYITLGEFPELINTNTVNYTFVRQYLRQSILEKIFRKDIRIFKVEKSQELESVYKNLMQNIAQMINQENLGREIALSKPSIKKYQLILEKAFLLKFVNNNLRGVRAQEKSFDKVFSSSINLTMAILGLRSIDELVYPSFRGHLIENYVYNQLTRLVKNIDTVMYYNKNKKEVDLVLITGQLILPIEIKAKMKLKKSDLNHLWFYMQNIIYVKDWFFMVVNTRR